MMSLVEELVKAHPEQGILQFLYGMALAGRGETERSEVAFEQARSLGIDVAEMKRQDPLSWTRIFPVWIRRPESPWLREYQVPGKTAIGGNAIDKPRSPIRYAPDSAEVAELADALGSGSSGLKLVGVRVPPSAPSPPGKSRMPDSTTELGILTWLAPATSSRLGTSGRSGAGWPIVQSGCGFRTRQRRILPLSAVTSTYPEIQSWPTMKGKSSVRRSVTLCPSSYGLARSSLELSVFVVDLDGYRCGNTVGIEDRYAGVVGRIGGDVAEDHGAFQGVCQGKG